MTREQMHYDVAIVGAGPAGLSAAIRLKQLANQEQMPLSVCVLEKGAEVGAHILSGAVFDPRALNELLPNWLQQNTSLKTPVTEDQFYFLSAKRAFRLPTPPSLKNHGHYIISLGQLCCWLAEQATELGVEIFAGFAGAQILWNDKQEVAGVITGDMGLNQQGLPGEQYQPGVEIHARYTLFAEGARGSLTKQLIEHFNLQKNSQPQTYGLGIKELWEVDPSQHHPGRVIHTLGWPLDQKTYGGGFIYHWGANQISVGLVVGLDYQNPSLSPFEEMQRLKTHPRFQALFATGKRIRYGARAINEGGWQSIPKLTFPGGALIGCSAGFVDVPKIKGSHNAMKSGMLAAEAVIAALQQQGNSLDLYRQTLQQSWVGQELYRVRNVRPAFHYGLWFGMAFSALDLYLVRGRWPFTFKHQQDHRSLKGKIQYQKIIYPKADGKITFDRNHSVYLSNTYHHEDQPVHLQLRDPRLAIDVNWQQYGSPEQYYCPAGVYEIILNENGTPRLQINAQNCIHCKTCDIKDPMQNINWVPPNGGEGPNYAEM